MVSSQYYSIIFCLWFAAVGTSEGKPSSSLLPERTQLPEDLSFVVKEPVGEVRSSSDNAMTPNCSGLGRVIFFISYSQGGGGRLSSLLYPFFNYFYLICSAPLLAPGTPSSATERPDHLDH